MTSAYIPSRGRLALLTVLALTLLTAVLALRSRPADAATPVIQNSQGESATFEQSGNLSDNCTSTYAFVSVTGVHSTATTAGGPASITNQTVLNGYATAYNECSNSFRETQWDNVPLATNQFRIDGALNKAILSGTIPATWGDGCDAQGCNYSDPGSGTFNVTWQRTGDQLVSPSHGASHTPGQDIVNVTFSGQSYAANASGSIVLNGAGQGSITVTPTTDEHSYQDGAYLSRNMSVQVIVVRPPQPITIPAGHTLTISNVVLGCYDRLIFGYQLDMGANTAIPGTGACGHSVPDTIIGPFAQDAQIRVWITDTSAQGCSGYPADYTYYSDGLHALVTGTNPYQVDIMDSGVGCHVPADEVRRPSAPRQGNVSLTLTISP